LHAEATDVDALIAPDGSNLVRFRIPADRKTLVLAQLIEFGVHRRALFPDLEGLSAYLNWDTRRAAQLARYLQSKRA
jgi:hypothetical protein